MNHLPVLHARVQHEQQSRFSKEGVGRVGGDQLFTHRTNLPSCPPTNPSRVQHDRPYTAVGHGRAGDATEYLERTLPASTSYAKPREALLPHF